MNGTFLFNDTFDNLSFSESGRFKNPGNNHKVDYSINNIKPISAQNSIEDCVPQNISVDDSIFLNESFPVCERNIQENQRNGSIGNSEELFANSENSFTNTQKDKETDVSVSKNLTQQAASTQDNCDLSLWGLPDTVLQKYKQRGVTSMFQWQAKCLANAKLLENNANLVYSAPTSAGKTLVAEILAIKTVLERRKKVLFILPFISVVREKMFYFQDILGSSGVRVEGFMGSHNPPGGFSSIQVAICTIEKANGIINRLLEEGNLSDVGTVIVDEIHLLGDSSRGYLLELMLTKLQYMSIRFENIHIQIIGMSATLPNLDLLGKWLNAELYVTDFRPIPLFERCLVAGEIYNKELILERRLLNLPELETDTDNILQLCLETIQNSCSVLIFCPTKNWCENLAQQIASAFWKLGCSKTPFGIILRRELNSDSITELIQQLKRCPVGLDNILRKTVSYGAAFHHAGLTMDERDIIEAAFRNGVLRVLVATSTLSSGVNLPARRVIIRTPMFHGKPIDSLVYRQMIGRAGRMGRDSSGESILICQKNDYRIAKELLSAQLQPIESCLEGAGKLKRAILEVVASGVAATPEDVKLFTKCTLLAASERENEDLLLNPIEESMEFLIKNEFIRLQELEDGTSKYVATSLGKACLSSSMPPEEGLALFAELEKARQCFVLETELHLIYLVTPYSICNQWNNLDWMLFLELWDKLPSSMKRVGELVGIRESYIINGTRNKIQTNTAKLYQKFQIHRRFFTALALQDLVNEIPLNDVAIKFGCSRGMLQSLQQSASTFAGMLTIFSRQLGWSSVEILISQFQDRLQFGISRDLLDLMRLPILNGPRARALYSAGIETLVNLASAEIDTIENILHKVGPFESEKERDGESEFDTNKRNKIRGIWVTGKEGLTEREAAVMLIQDARRHLQLEMGLAEAKWGEESNEIKTDSTITNLSLKNIEETNSSKIDGSIKLPVVAESSETSNLSPVKEANNSRGINLIVSDKLASEPTENINKDEEHTRPSDISFNLSTTEENIDVILASETTENINEDGENVSFNLSTESAFEEEALNLNMPRFSSESLSLNQENIDVNSADFCDNIKETQAKLNEIPPSMDNILNESLQSLFEESFECDNYTTSKKSSVNGNRGDSALEFVNGSFLENAFVSSFDLELETSANLENQQSKVLEAQNSSPGNDLILNSQTDAITSILCNTHTSSSKIRRKRHKENSYKSSILDEDESFNDEATPSKRKKTLNKTLFKQKLPTSTVDLTNLQIVDVCNDTKLFQTFCNELLEQKIVSLSFACKKTSEARPIIGTNILRRNSIKNIVSPPIEGFVYKERQVIGVAVTWGSNTAYFISLDNEGIINKSKIATLNKLLSQKTTKLQMFDCKEQMKVGKLCCGLDFFCTVQDPKVADWLLQPEGKEKNLQAMAVTYSLEAVSLSQLAGNCKGVGSTGLDLYSTIEPRIRAAVEAVVTWHLCESVSDALIEQNENLIKTYRTEMGCLVCLARMELTGLGVNMSQLQDLADDLKYRTGCLEKQAYTLAGCKFSLISSTDVAKVLGMYKGRKISTNKQTLEQQINPVADLILQWRKLNCTLTKMVYPLIRLVQNDRIYGICVTHTSTGRISMHEPNLQNVPRDFDFEDSTISCRKVFVPEVHCSFLSADYCQLELRLLAHLSQDPVLCPILKSGEDVFKSIAAKWKNIHEAEVDDVLRQWAKQICYGIIYGMGTKTLAKQLCVSEDEANNYLDSFRDRYPSIQRYSVETVENCRNLGYVETLAGRRRYLPNINHQNPAVRFQAERQAINTTVQGSAADLIKLAMVVLEERFKNKFRHPKNVPKLVLHLHDELLFEVHEKYLDKTARILKKTMEEAVKLSVPFPVKLKAGLSWGTMKELVL